MQSRLNKSTRALKLAKAAKDNASTLAALAARGREDGAFGLYRIAAFATQWLTHLCRKQPELFTAIAARKMAWPVMWGAHRDTLKDNKELIEELKLASGTGINFSSNGKTFRSNHPANQIAIYVHQIAQALRRAPIDEWDVYEAIQLGSIARSSSLGRTGIAVHVAYQQLHSLEQWGQRGTGRMLPALSKSTASEWTKATPELFRLLFGEKFETHPTLRELRKHVEFRTTHGDGKKGGAGILRQEMLRAVKQAWHSIAID
jgi:hypothetical protein